MKSQAAKEKIFSIVAEKNKLITDIFINNISYNEENKFESTGEQSLLVLALEKKCKYLKIEFLIKSNKVNNTLKLYYGDKDKNNFTEKNSYLLGDMDGSVHTYIIKMNEMSDGIRIDMGTLPAIMDIKYFHILPLKGLPLIRYKVRRIINFMKKVIKSIFHNKGLISQYINEVKKSGWRIAFDKTKNWVVKENKVDHTTQVTTPYRVVIKKEILEERKKVLHFIENFYTGGSSRLVIDLIEYFGHKYQHKIFTSAYRGEDEFLDVDVSIVDVNDTDLIQALIAQYNPDIIHVHIWEGQWYEKVFDILEGVKECKIIQNVNTPIQPIIRDNIDKYVFVSNYVLREFHKEDDKSMVIYPGSNFNMFNRELRDNYLEKDTIGMVYRLGYDKLNANSIDVFIKVVQKRPQTKVIIVGGGPRYDEYVEKVEQSGVLKNFTFTGYVPYEELPKWYRKLTIFLAPVWQESFGQVSPFAMNMGIPVAGYNVGALEEIIVNKDILAPPEDSDKLSDIVVDLLDDYDRCITIGKVNQQRASAHFAVESMVEGYEKLYDEIVSGNVSQTERL